MEKINVCSKIDRCSKVLMILDKDFLDFQYLETIKIVCSKCLEKEKIVTLEVHN